MQYLLTEEEYAALAPKAELLRWVRAEARAGRNYEAILDAVADLSAERKSILAAADAHRRRKDALHPIGDGLDRGDPACEQRAFGEALAFQDREYDPRFGRRSTGIEIDEEET